MWTHDVERGEELARRVEAGAVCVNDAQINYSALELPMGGWKASGLGTRHGAGGHPQVHQDPVTARDQAGAQARAVHVPLHGRPHEAAAQVPQRDVRARLARLTSYRRYGLVVPL